MAAIDTLCDDPGPRFLFYSHDGMGLGHTRRNLAIAAALTERCPLASVLLATSTDDAHHLGLPPRVEILKLPGLRKTGNERYQSRRLDVSGDEIRQLRSSLLEAAIRSFHPAVMLVDKHPFGARGELRAGLAGLKEQGGRAVLGWRDILDDPATTRRELVAQGLRDLIAEHYDRVLVYGERAVFDPIAEYDLPEAVASRTRFCGYVLNKDDDGAPEISPPTTLSSKNHSRPVVLATAGGGEDGFALLEQFLRAAKGAPWQGIGVAGPMMSEGELRILRRLATWADVSLRAFVPRLPNLFDRLDALVCMGGYNTLTEAVAHGVPTVCVPRVTPRTEQFIRAREFERLGLLRMIHPEQLTIETLRDSLSATLGGRFHEQRRAQTSLNFDGATHAAGELMTVARMGVAVPEPAAVAGR